MEDNPAPAGRPLMDATIFKENFDNTWENETYLCYEVEVWKDDAWGPGEELPGFLWNKSCVSLGLSTGGSPEWKRVEVLVHRRELEGSRHAEFCFLKEVPYLNLDKEEQYRLTWYISWSPCPDCAHKLIKFLRKNSHVSLRIFAAGIPINFCGHEDGLRKLRDAGAQLAIMTRDEYEHCWDTFVDNQGQKFQSWTGLKENIGAQCQKLESILGSQKN